MSCGGQPDGERSALIFQTFQEATHDMPRSHRVVGLCSSPETSAQELEDGGCNKCER